MVQFSKQYEFEEGRHPVQQHLLLLPGGHYLQYRMKRKDEGASKRERKRGREEGLDNNQGWRSRVRNNVSLMTKHLILN